MKQSYQNYLVRFLLVWVVLFSFGCTAPVPSLQPQTVKTTQTERGTATITLVFEKPPQNLFGVQALPATTARIDINISTASGGPVYDSKNQIIEIAPFTVTDEIRRNGKTLTIADLPTIKIRIAVVAFDATDKVLADKIQEVDILSKSRTGGKPIDAIMELTPKPSNDDKPGVLPVPTLATPNSSGAPSSWTVDLSWSSSTGATYYRLHRNNQALPTKITDTSYADKNLTGSSYTYYVKACNDSMCSVASESQTVTVPSEDKPDVPSPPTLNSPGVSGTPSSWSAALSWSSSSDADYYDIYRDGSIAYGKNTETAYTNNDLTAGSYTYYVKACNSSGCSSPSNSKTANAPITLDDSVPPAPLSVNGSASGSSGNYTINVNWSSVSGATYYEISDNWNSNWPANPITGTSGSTTTDNFFGGQTYVAVSVKACNANGCSSSTTTRINKPADAGCPTNPTTISNDQTVTVCLNKNRQRLGFSGTSGQTVTIRQNKVTSGDSFLRLYNPSGSQAASDDDGGGSPNSLISSYALTSSGTWQIEAGTYNDNDAGNFTVSLTVGQIQPPGGGNTSPPAIPEFFSLPSVTGSSTSWSAVLSWSSSTEATFYEVYRDGGKIASPTTTAYTDSNRTASYHDYYIKACNSNGCSASTVTRRANRPALNTPATPEFFSLPSVTGSSTSWSAVLSWSSSIGATFYEVYRDGSKIASPTTPTYTDSNRTASYHDYYIKACNSEGCSSPTVTRRANKLSTVPGTPTLNPPSVSGTSTSYSATLSWSSVSGATYYQLSRSMSTLPTLTVTSYYDGNLTNNYYVYVVRACNSNGCSPESNSRRVDKPMPPSTPTFSVVVSGSYSLWSAQLSWSSISGATSYEVYRDNTKISTTSSLSFTDNNRTAASHDYVLKACNAIGCSSSPSQRANRPAGPPPAPVLSATTRRSTPQFYVAELTWTNSNGATIYKVYRNGNFVTETTNLSASPTATTTASSSWYVKACNNAGCTNSNTINTTAP